MYNDCQWIHNLLTSTSHFNSLLLKLFIFFINGFNFTCFLSFYLLSFIFLLCSCIRFPFFLLKPISSSLQWQNFPTGINKVSSYLIFYESAHKGKTLSNIKDTVTVKSTTERWPGKPLQPYVLCFMFIQIICIIKYVVPHRLFFFNVSEITFKI